MYKNSVIVKMALFSYLYYLSLCPFIMGGKGVKLLVGSYECVPLKMVQTWSERDD
jgi:hypothetical protein